MGNNTWELYNNQDKSNVCDPFVFASKLIGLSLIELQWNKKAFIVYIICKEALNIF